MSDTSTTIGRPRGRARLWMLWRSPRDQRRAGRLMIGLGVVGSLVAVFGTIVGWVFVGQLTDASDNTLEVTVQTLDAVDDTIDLAEEVLISTVDAVDSLAGTLESLSVSFESGTTAIDDVASLADTLVPSLTEVGDTVRTLERVGGQVDGALDALSNIPFAPDYDSDTGLAETFGRLADTLEELPEELSGTATSLNEFTASAGELQVELDRLTMSVGVVAADLANTAVLVDQYRTSVSDARDLAVETKSELDISVVLMRILLVTGGITLLLSQIVPLWLGRSLLDDRPSPDS